MDKELLFKVRLPEADVEVPGIGTVRVRGLSRAEVMAIVKFTDQSPDGPRALILERKMIAMAMIDPELSEAEAGQWQKSSTPGDMEPVTDQIQKLSGMGEYAPKSGLSETGDGSGSGVHVLSGSGAVDDSGGTSGADE